MTIQPNDGPRRTIWHLKCGTTMTINPNAAAAYARNPRAFDVEWCAKCRKGCPVHEFVWVNEATGKPTTEKVGP